MKHTTLLQGSLAATLLSLAGTGPIRAQQSSHSELAPCLAQTQATAPIADDGVQEGLSRDDWAGIRAAWNST